MAMDTIPLAMPADLLDEVRQTADDTHQSSADVMRQAIKAGLPQVRKALGKSQRVTNVDPLPDDVMERLYQERNDDPEGIEVLLKAQPFQSAE